MKNDLHPLPSQVLGDEMNIESFFRGVLEALGAIATLLNMFACMVFIGMLNLNDPFSKFGALVLMIWALASGVSLILRI